MAKATKSPLTKKEIVQALKDKGVIPVEKRNFSPDEIVELQEMQRLVNSRRFEAAQVNGNTALIPDGQKVGEQLDAITRLLENVKNQYVSQKLVECGYGKDEKCNISLTTGEVIPLKDESKDTSDTSTESTGDTGTNDVPSDGSK